MSNQKPSPTIVWFRQDLRLSDHPALSWAIEQGAPIIPVYIYAPQEEGSWASGGASRWWLHHALEDLDAQLREHGSRLIIRAGDSLETLRELIHETNAGAVCWGRRYEPAIRERDGVIKKQLKEQGLRVESFNTSLLYEPHEVSNKQGKPYQVFTPFWKQCLTQPIRPIVNVPLKALAAPKKFPASKPLKALKLLPAISWDKAFYDTWEPTAQGVRTRLKRFTKDALARYSKGRDLPAEEGTSRMSPYLHFGQISPHQIVAAAREQTDLAKGSGYRYHAELGWREFGYHLLYHFPETPTVPLRPEFEHFPWVQDEALLKAWQQGQTGYPIVDAAMRQLWQTGWMHNRARMIVGSLLVKHMLQPWQEGAGWFWDTLVDADLASNTLGWQWIGGCGADAAPYFRVFNPMTQGEKFDCEGAYVREYVPELASLPAEYIHQPWEAPAEVLRNAGVTLGKTYPHPVIDHKTGRNRALTAYEKLKALRNND